MDLNASDQALIDGAQDRWETSVAGFEDALKVQAGVVGNIAGARTAMSYIVGASQSATGALQAAQAGHQLLALHPQQIADLTALVAAQGLAPVFHSPRDAGHRSQGHAQFRRYMKSSGN